MIGLINNIDNCTDIQYYVKRDGGQKNQRADKKKRIPEKSENILRCQIGVTCQKHRQVKNSIDQRNKQRCRRELVDQLKPCQNSNISMNNRKSCFQSSHLLELLTHYLKNNFSVTVTRITLNQRQILPGSDRDPAVYKRDCDER